MDKKEYIPSRILELELVIKLLEYLKVNNVIDDGMYNHLVKRILNKIPEEKKKINNSKSKINDYKFIT